MLETQENCVSFFSLSGIGIASSVQFTFWWFHGWDPRIRALCCI